MAALVQSILEGGDGSGLFVDVECHVSKGLPAIVIVGFASKAVDEAKERLRGAFTNSKLELPKKRITINLAPADIPKDSSSFDIPMAVSILIAGGQLEESVADQAIFIGELGLDGSVRPVRGIIGKILASRQLSADPRTFFLPRANMEQASLIPNVHLVAVDNLRSLYLHLSGSVPLKTVSTGGGIEPKQTAAPPSHTADLADVVGQARAKRVLEIAAAGGHNVMLAGSPGAGKSMLAKCMSDILPPLKRDEMLQITHLHSLASKNYDKLVVSRPFRTPHHSASHTSVVGGGQHPRPGEISLSHHGVLFFDEFPEFNRQTIEALRQPLEDKYITVARAKDTISFPANFILIATANPCPCGYYGTSKECSCLPHQIQQYRRKMSGPIVDRIDMWVDVDEVEHAHLLSDNSHREDSQQVRRRVEAARQQQAARFDNENRLNASLTNRELKQFVQITPEAKGLLDQAAEKLSLSPRAYMRTLKVARTIADLADSEQVSIEHVSEALQYRKQADYVS